MNSTNLDEKEGQKKPVDEIQTAFAGLQKIQVEDPGSGLHSKPGFEWQWTRVGFQRLIEGELKINKPALAPSTDSVLFALRELGIKEIYTLIDGKLLSIIINTTPLVACYIGQE